ncbi:MAG: InlB B-repeat-containing protein [Candidatus Saccharibacteria bacterium]|nr:InlB B-repeat-containing protein [Candidatus Saccharibacteria bacterium]
MMKEKRGILGKLLLTAGVFLVVAGVFAFQTISRADENEGASGNDGSVGVSIPLEDTNDLDIDNPDGGNTDEGTSEEVVGDPEPAEVYTYRIDYYDPATYVEPETGEGAEAEDEPGEQDPEQEEQPGLLLSQSRLSSDKSYTFAVEDFVPEGMGDFLGWYVYGDEKIGEYYQAGDEIVLNSEAPELKLMAKFAVLETYVLRYNANGGAGAPGVEAKQSYYGSSDFVVSGTIPVKEGYEFRGWAVDGDTNNIYAPGSTIRSVSFDEPLTLYAVWAEIKTYTLMYDVNGGNGVFEVQACKSASGHCDFTLSAAAPTKNSAEFIGWQRGTETFAPGSVITVTESNTILVANWNPIYTFTLVYTSEEGTENLPEPAKCETAMGTCTFIVTDKEPVRNGYIFRGWRWEDQPDMLAKAGDELVIAIDSSKDLKIKAVWSRIYTVLNSGEVFGAGERVILRSTAENVHFEKLIIDSQEVPAEYYTISEANTTSVVLLNAFSQSLASGEHGFTIVWSDGEANGIISVNQNEDGTKRFLVVDASGTTDGAGLVYRPKAGAVSKESSGVVNDSATDNQESNFDAVRTIILVAIGAFVVIYIINRIYVHRKMSFIEEI